MEDIQVLISQMHRRGMKLIMDLVPNHTSDQHRWFQESRKSRDNPYSDYYYWFDTPPNQWKSMFGGSAYAFDSQRGQYYLHSYAPGQPDLNWENPKVAEEMCAVVDFWTELGVDGFRIDVIDQISKDFEAGRNCFGPHLHEYIHKLFGRDKVKHLFIVGECWTNALPEIRRHVHQDRDELSTLFQFDHLECGRNGKFNPASPSLKPLWDHLRRWSVTMQEEDLLFSLFTDNHDNGWLLGRVADTANYRYEAACCIAAMVYLLRGVCFVYQGQELGMINPHYDTIEAFDDVESINKYNALCEHMSSAEALEHINFGGRDNTRRPLCWSAEKNAGFTTGTPWISLHSDYQSLNLATDMEKEKSVWRFYKRLLHLRSSHPVLTQGIFIPVSPENADYCAYERTLDGEKVLLVCNFEKQQHIPCARSGKLLLSNYGLAEKNDTLYRPYEVAVFTL